MLPLNDNRWKELAHRGRSNGKRSELDPSAPFVPDELKKMLENPHNLDVINNLHPYLSSEGTTWEAAYAAVPYIIQTAKQLLPKDRVDYLIAVGFIVLDSCLDNIKPYLKESYEEALCQALRLLAETLLEDHTANETRYLLLTVATLKGHSKLSRTLEQLDCMTHCPRCGKEFVELDDWLFIMNPIIRTGS